MEGYSFTGWFTSISDGTNITLETVFTEDTTVYAHWTAKDEVTVTFDMQGHGTAPETQTVNYGNKVVRPDDPTAEGFDFGGWYKDSGCITEWNFDTDTVIADMTLYAKWTEIPETYTITFDSNGGTPTGMTEVTGTEGKLTEFPDDPAMEGYSFAGWYTQAEDGTEIALDTVFTEDTTVYAHWTDGPGPVIMATVTFEPSSGGSVSVPSIQVPQNSKINVSGDTVWFLVR